MATFAVMSGNIVTNVIVADTKEDAELVTSMTCIEYTKDNPAGVEWIYNPETETFSAPVVEEAPVTEE